MILILLCCIAYTTGQEFDVLFLSTVESVLSDGRPFDPLKSLCHPAVFNTAITRARSLVIAVGNPNILIKCEKSMGSKFKCWEEFITRCKAKGTYDEDTVDGLVALANKQEKFKKSMTQDGN